MKVLIVGGSGLVGSNLEKCLSSDLNYSKVLATHMNCQAEKTVYYDPSRNLPDYIADIKWDVIIHTGALTNVDLCETEADLSYDLTVNSTKRILDLAIANDAKLVYISTDYVFDGKNGPYVETDPTNPLNTYGKHKLEAEQLLSLYENFLIVRVTNVYGYELRKKNFIARMLNELSEKESLIVNAPIDQYATPVNAYDIARVIDLLIKDDKHGIYHIGGTDYMSRVQILQRINKYFDSRITIVSVKTSDLNQKANRPLLGGLLSFKFMSEYPDFKFTNIDDHIKNNYAKPS